MVDEEVTKSGGNLSGGERLLCFARALLHRRSILVLDEATSNLDEATDGSIQTLLESEFGMTTVLTIAHRLVTVIDYDKLLVMGGGRLLEAGPPLELLLKAGGELQSMAAALGAEGGAKLLKRAKRERAHAPVE